MNHQSEIIKHTENWVANVIVKYNICPFARREVERGTIRYIEIKASKQKEILKKLIDECLFLDTNCSVETTLFIIPQGLLLFYDFLDLVELSNDLLFEQGYEGIYQLASFHPDYCFSDVDPEDASNYTNRSPYPTLHIIRESSMQKALENHPDPDAIPLRNVEFVRKKGSVFFADLLASCCTHMP
ncbi:DUF1415 domain-containing protein [Psychromonas sp. CD1]|uniref:DUF1415 domain-containing protein n=1 Tax=Psychromonas sp. CD1 TaxID=1979839 RepID=UPI000B9C2461|nr:DUF1415 domain-containing protein [Psychromonas sp. CD1]